MVFRTVVLLHGFFSFGATTLSKVDSRALRILLLITVNTSHSHGRQALIVHADLEVDIGKELLVLVLKDPWIVLFENLDALKFAIKCWLQLLSDVEFLDKLKAKRGNLQNRDGIELVGEFLGRHFVILVQLLQLAQVLFQSENLTILTGGYDLAIFFDFVTEIDSLDEQTILCVDIELALSDIHANYAGIALLVCHPLSTPFHDLSFSRVERGIIISTKGLFESRLSLLVVCLLLLVGALNTGVEIVSALFDTIQIELTIM